MKKGIYILLIGFAIFQIPSYSQTVFQKQYGGMDEDHPTSLVETANHNLILGGYSRSFILGENRSFLIKTDPSGNTIWTKYFSDSLVNHTSKVLQTSGGNLLLTGTVNNPFTTGMIIYTDSNASVLWAGTWSAEIKSAIQTTDGGFLLVGRGFAPIYGMQLLKLDSTGVVQWTKELRSWNGFFSSIAIVNLNSTNDGGYVFTGLMAIAPGQFGKVLLIKTDGSANVQWAKTLGPGSVYYDGGISVYNTSDNGYVVTGTTVDSTGHKIYHIKTDSTGSVIWAKKMGFPNLWTSPDAVIKKDNDHVIMSAFYEVTNGDDIGLLLELDPSGTLLWSRSLSDQGSSQRPMILTPDGIVYSTTTSTQDLQLIKTDHWGHIFCLDSTVIIPVFNSVISDSSVTVTDSAGTIFTILPISDYVFSFSQTVICDSTLSSTASIHSEVKVIVFPNPTTGKLYIQFEDPYQQVTMKITDLCGRELKRISCVDCSESPIEIEGPAGCYFLQLLTENTRSIIRVIKN